MNFVIIILLITRFYCCVLGRRAVGLNDIGEKFPRPARISNLEGDFVLGGLFPVRLSEKDFSKCSQGNAKYKYMATLSGNIECYRLNFYAVMWIEAMLFAIKEINGRSDILPGIKLGYDIRDTANNVDNAINCSLDFILPRINQSLNYLTQNQTIGVNCSCDSNNKRKKICAVVGGAGSKISQAINYILGVESIPQISYSSTSPSLSDKKHFPSFLRTIPPDYIQAQVMADLVSYYKWTYVSTIATDEDYGRLGIEAFKKEIKTRNACISVDELFHPDNNLQTTKDKIKHIIQKLKEDKKASVVVLFCEGPNALAVLEEAEKQGLRDKIWIGTEAWGDKPTLLPFKSSTVGGMLGVVPWKGDIEEFEKHMEQLTPLDSGHNPWFDDYWKGEFGCIHNGSDTPNVTHCNNETDHKNCTRNVTSLPVNTTRWKCPGNKLPTAAGIQLNKAPNVMDSVYAIAWALHKMLNCTSGPEGSCSGKRSEVIPRDLLSYVRRTSFTGTLGYPIKFDKHGDTKGKCRSDECPPCWMTIVESKVPTRHVNRRLKPSHNAWQLEPVFPTHSSEWLRSTNSFRL